MIHFTPHYIFDLNFHWLAHTYYPDSFAPAVLSKMLFHQMITWLPLQLYLDSAFTIRWNSEPSYTV